MVAHEKEIFLNYYILGSLCQLIFSLWSIVNEIYGKISLEKSFTNTYRIVKGTK